MDFELGRGPRTDVSGIGADSADGTRSGPDRVAVGDHVGVRRSSREGVPGPQGGARDGDDSSHHPEPSSACSAAFWSKLWLLALAHAISPHHAVPGHNGGTSTAPSQKSRRAAHRAALLIYPLIVDDRVLTCRNVLLVAQDPV